MSTIVKGNPNNLGVQLAALREIKRRIPEQKNLSGVLPFMFQIKGKPFTLQNHFPMQPMYSKTIPPRRVLKCGRQIAKTTTLCAQGILLSGSMKNMTRLYVLPLQEMTRRLSVSVFKRLLDDSPIKKMLVGPGCMQNVFQRDFLSGSIVYFSYAFKDCERTRGISSDMIDFDEVQDIDFEFVPIIEQSASASWLRAKNYSGTPKSFDNTLQCLFDESSQAEWVIPCGCGHKNICTVEFDLLKILGPVKNIEQYGTALICANCGKPICCEQGCWVHRIPERSATFPGYHIPQPIMPMHYADEERWSELLYLSQRDQKTFYNECLGESCDVGDRLISLEELRNACKLHECNYKIASGSDFFGRYGLRIIGVDWGGGGEGQVSYTTIAVVGLTPDGRYELIYGERLAGATSDLDEVARILHLYRAFNCSYLAHDFAGAGAQHETILLQSGFPSNAIIAFSYERVKAGEMINFKPAIHGKRQYYGLDKTRSIIMLCTLLKLGMCRLTEYESSRGLLEDFMNIHRETRTTAYSGDYQVIVKKKTQSDDFVHALNFALCGMYKVSGRLPVTPVQGVNQDLLDETEGPLSDLPWRPDLAPPRR